MQLGGVLERARTPADSKAMTGVEEVTLEATLET